MQEEILEITKDDILIDGKNKWREHKMATPLLAEVYRLIGQEKKAERLDDCATNVSFRVYESGEKRLNAANFCRVRLCPMCTWRRSLKIFSQVSKVMNVLESNFQYRFLFMTFTVKNVSGDELSDALDKLNQGFFKMIRRKEIKKIASGGWFKCLEITHNWKRNDYHPHIHAILVVRRSYFNRHKEYLSQNDITELWRDCCDLDYKPLVDVRTVKKDSEGKFSKAVAEVAKYAVKPNDYFGESYRLGMKKKSIERNLGAICETVETLSNALHRRRLISFGGQFKDIHAMLELDDAEDGDLIHVGADENFREDLMYQVVRYKWHMGIEDYIDVRKLYE